MPPAHPPLIACVDSSDDLVEFLRDVFVQDGLRAVPYASSVREGIEPLLAFLTPLAPDAVIYGVSFPYQEHWAQLEQLRARLPGPAFVVTTTNKRALDAVVGPTPTIEILGKPFDVEQLVAAVHRALPGRP